jgi:hypothetical protein
MSTIALLGAGGKMGLRLARNLKGSRFTVRHVEIGERGKAALAAEGFTVTPIGDALAGAAIVILALPDNRLGNILHEISPKVTAGTMVMMLDVAAQFAGDLPDRPDLTYFITHPCHPPVFSEESEPAAHRDFFGGEHARQHIVCCLASGPEEHYALGEEVARTIYKPVMRSHRCTVAQMAILEPVLSETVLATCLTILREATDEAARRGVPFEAARDFILGHLRVELAIVFEEKEGAVFSDGALKAIAAAKSVLFQPDWKKVFEPDAIAESVRRITRTG